MNMSKGLDICGDVGERRKREKEKVREGKWKRGRRWKRKEKIGLFEKKC